MMCLNTTQNCRAVNLPSKRHPPRVAASGENTKVGWTNLGLMSIHNFGEKLGLRL